ncbi:Uncharacterised protein [Candidatus Anstonella stagnisolia]|nr:Uncharacterised protein [Candidatus Anstonella stagnisolia]
MGGLGQLMRTTPFRNARDDLNFLRRRYPLVEAPEVRKIYFRHRRSLSDARVKDFLQVIALKCARDELDKIEKAQAAAVRAPIERQEVRAADFSREDDAPGGALRRISEFAASQLAKWFGPTRGGSANVAQPGEA